MRASLASSTTQPRLKALRLRWQLVQSKKEKTDFESGRILNLVGIDADSGQGNACRYFLRSRHQLPISCHALDDCFAQRRCTCLFSLQRGQLLALCKSDKSLREFLQAEAFEGDENREVHTCRGTLRRRARFSSQLTDR